ncbi:MAG: type II toxin-antitoxin system YafQ family toxin [Oscillospiraceae bacterium]|nr:type II toxin-antitoxin system YafQ family toxin [Oscillospiraceae bacterium]
MLTFETTAKFRRDIKRVEKRGLDLSLMDAIVQTLLEEEPLDPKYNDHALIGNYKGFRECHIGPDWLLIYEVNKARLILTAIRTGSHSDLLRK